MLYNETPHTPLAYYGKVNNTFNAPKNSNIRLVFTPTPLNSLKQRAPENQGTNLMYSVSAESVIQAGAFFSCSASSADATISED